MIYETFHFLFLPFESQNKSKRVQKSVKKKFENPSLKGGKAARFDGKLESSRVISTGVAEDGGGAGKQGRNGVEGSRLSMTTAARDGHGLVERVGSFRGQALPGCTDRRRHRRRA